MPMIGEDITRVIGHLIKEGDLNSKIRRILEKEIRRRLTEYQLIDMGFQKKYGITLEEFEKGKVIKEKGYSELFGYPRCLEQPGFTGRE